MQDDLLFRRTAAISAILSAPVALGASFILLNALDYDFEISEDPAAILRLDPPIDDAYRVSQVIGVFGYSLLVVPVALYLWYWLNPEALCSSQSSQFSA